MLMIDTHYHASPHWWEPVEVFVFHMDRCGIDRGVLVQSMGDFDPSYILGAARRYPGRLSAIGLVDTRTADFCDRMEQLAAAGVEGFRFSLSDPLQLQAPHGIWRKAEELGSVASVVGTTAQFASPEFEEAIIAAPGLPIVIEHMGVLGRLTTGGHGGDNAVPTAPYTEYRRVLGLARHPNVYIKVPGFAEFMPRPRVFTGPAFDLDAAPPFIDMCTEAFGAARMMVGTDPSSSVREGYANVWSNLRQYLAKYPREDQAAILGTTAAGLFPFRGARVS
jgi:L-fuconolactonase